MQINRHDLSVAVKSGLITKAQADKLWLLWQKQQSDVVRFTFAHVLYYLGGMLAISAVSLFVTLAWESLRGLPLLTMTIGMFAFGISLAHYFLNKQLRIPAGIMATFCLALVPLAIYNLQILLGMNPDTALQYANLHTRINWYWTNMELATLLVGAVMVYYYRFPFLLLPIAVVLWYMSMDLWPLLFHVKEFTLDDRATFTMCYGLIVLAVAVYVDLQRDDHQDYAFWLYIFGVLTFWCGLSAHYSASELAKFAYSMINLAMIFIGTFLNRRVFVVFGVFGLLGYLAHLAASVFANSLSFPLVLILLGLIIIFIAAGFTRIEGKLNAFMRPYIPKKILDRRDH